MSDYDRRGKSEEEEECNAYYRRKQSPNINRVMGDADLPLVKSDRNAEQENYNWKGESGKDRAPAKSSTIWDDEAWKDK